MWLAISALTGRETSVAVGWGLLGPLVVACGSWVLAERTYRRRPESLTALMMGAFAGKVLFFGVYLAVMLRVLSVSPVPFVASFAGYFIALHLAEALCLRRLFAPALAAHS